MKETYFVNLNQYGQPDASIISESVLEAAERGLNYIDPDSYIFFGDYESEQAARQAYYNECGETLLCLQYEY